MIGKNIRRIRQQKGVSQWQLSQAVGATTGAIWMIERGLKPCPNSMVRAIADALNVSESEIKDNIG